jgi:hypothetical protein
MLRKELQNIGITPDLFTQLRHSFSTSFRISYHKAKSMIIPEALEQRGRRLHQKPQSPSQIALFKPHTRVSLPAKTNYPLDFNLIFLRQHQELNPRNDAIS